MHYKVLEKPDHNTKPTVSVRDSAPNYLTTPVVGLEALAYNRFGMRPAR